MEPNFMLPVSIRDRLSELSGAELKVWLCYRSHANATGVAWPGRELLHEETGLSHDTISSARAGLGRKRWLIPAQADRNSRPNSGKFGSPRFSPVIPEAKAVTDGNRDGKAPSRVEPETEYQRDGESQVDRDGKMPFYRDGENQVDRDGKTPSLSITNEVFPKELFPKEGAELALRASATASVAAPLTYEDDPNDGVPGWPERPLTAKQRAGLIAEDGEDDVPY
jgi:hypothetical protein